MISTQRERLAQAIADLWRPRQRVQRSAWCEENLRVPEIIAAQGTRWDWDRFPWSRGIVDLIDNPQVRNVFFMGPAQVGKTFTLAAILLSDAALYPAPSMLAGPDESFVAELRDVIYAIADASPAFRGRLPEEHARNFRHIDLGASRCFLGWSGSAQSLSGKPCRTCYATEVDRWRTSTREGPTIHLLAKRTRAYHRWRVLYEGTPTDEQSMIARFYARSNQCRYLVPCPHCGNWQELRFFPRTMGKYAGRGGVVGLKDEQGNYLPAEEVSERAHYLCLHGCKINDTEKQQIVLNGKWCPRGQTIDRSGKLCGKPRKSWRDTGFRLDGVVSLTRSFGELAAAWVEAQKNQADVQAFLNNDIGLPHKKSGPLPRWREIGRRLESDCGRGVVPEWAVFLTAYADVQVDHVYWVVRAWGEQTTSQLVDFGRYDQVVTADGAMKNSDLDQLGQLLERAWPVVGGKNICGQAELRVRYLGVDMQYRTADLHAWSRQHPCADRIRLCAGQTGLVGYYQYSLVERNARTGKLYAGGLKRWGLNVDAFRSDVQSRWNIAPCQPGCWLLPSGISAYGETYLRQLVNEQATYERSKHGRVYRKWSTVIPGIGNHYWDCEVGARAIAEMVAENNWSNLAARATPISHTQQAQPERVSYLRRPGKDWLRRQ